MSSRGQAVQKLRQLGLTRTEAEVYLATLETGASGPVSAYKVAQDMGRDPANLAKVLGALEKQGAVRVIQDKPRLYLPTPPEDFTRDLLEKMQEVGSDLVEELEDLAESGPTGLTLALRTNQQALDQAAALLKNCQDELLIHASNDVIEYMAREFGELASRSNCRVRFLGTSPSGIALAEDTLVTGPDPGPDGVVQPWLHMIVDRKCWLAASFNREEGSDLPCGWWGDDPAIAQVLTGPLDQACQPGKTTDSVVQPVGEFVSEVPVEPAADPQPDKHVEANSDESPTEKPLPEPPRPEPPRPEPPKPAKSGGLKFVVKHEAEE